MTNDEEKNLRNQIAVEVEDKMYDMHSCPNERDTVLGIILNSKEKPKVHCNTDCQDISCKCYHYAVIR